MSSNGMPLHALIFFSYNMYTFTHYRGDYFRREFSKLGEVRSLIPPNTNVTALTATATVKSRDKIVSILGMCNPVVISELNLI